ncbi:MAG: Gfo/Idh/MocA family oxidoreductase [Bryobacteraceae bacterium]|nr:Gfo/Idh/MocA family oxidoreductase [Bryobacteraceae bacterium]
MNQTAGSSRRTFLGALTAASYGRVLGANERIQIGFIGCGLIGLRHIADFKKLPEAALAAVCDVYRPRVENAQAQCGSSPKAYGDFRKLLEDKDIDAVVISTPDHWHALQTIMACAAGKDVYVEKPLSLFVKEGRWMVTAARRYKRVVQVGTQGRSASHCAEAAELIRSGSLGKVHTVRVGGFRNVMPGFGNPPDSDPPPDLDYDLWLGPAPRRPYNPNRALYNFRWFWDYSGGQMTNLGAHDLDWAFLLLGVKAPLAVASSGGRFALQDNGETPDTQDAVFEFPGFTALVSWREASGGRRQGGGTELFGTNGSMVIGRGGYEVIPDMNIPAQRQIPAWSLPPGHPTALDAAPTPRTQARKFQAPDPEPTLAHAQNFLDCIKSRKAPNADVEDGHRVTTACHLANLSLRVGRKLRWDAEKEEIIGDKEAAAQLVRPYRRPWDEVLRSFRL